jgi:hypothetical protein
MVVNALPLTIAHAAAFAAVAATRGPGHHILVGRIGHRHRQPASVRSVGIENRLRSDWAQCARHDPILELVDQQGQS